MQGLRSNSTIMLATENAGVRKPLLILCRHVVPWNLENARVKWQFYPPLDPEKARVRQPRVIFSPASALGTPEYVWVTLQF